MFVYIALISALGTALQNTFMAKYARVWDALSMSTYRSITLLISIAPLLFFVDYNNLDLRFSNFLPLIQAWVIASFSYWMFMQSLKYLPVGISFAIRYALNVIVVSILSFFLFDEILKNIEVMLIVIIIIGWSILSIFKVDFSHLDTKNFHKWIIFVIFSWILLGLSFSLLADGAKKLDPYLAWYFRESMILLSFLIISWIRKLATNTGLEKISLRQFWKIFLAASPTLLATWWFTLASTLGPVWMVSAVTVTGILITTILGILIYKEHLKPIQYIWIIMIIIAIVWIKIF